MEATFAACEGEKEDIVIHWVNFSHHCIGTQESIFYKVDVSLDMRNKDFKKTKAYAEKTLMKENNL